LEALQDQFLPLLAQLVETSEQLPPAYQKALRILAEHGWYMDMEMVLRAPLELSKQFEEGHVPAADELMAGHFEARMVEIEQFLVKSFPLRAKIIASAFLAHREGLFELSVPVLLTQADGICREASGYHLFLRNNKTGNPAVAAYVEGMAGDLMWRAVLSPLTEMLPINKSEKERGEGFAGLNRHMVLHGESLDYGTRINSLKAVSLINYVSQVLREAR
jgi:hypothetical protein